MHISFLEIDRWFAYNLFNRKKVFTVQLSDCVDEFGNTFGRHGSHFFINALRSGDNVQAVIDYLREFYSKNHIQSFNETVGRDIGSLQGECFFAPWESGRVRPLEKFLVSHKIGPTPEQSLSPIACRLLDTLYSIRSYGYKTVFNLHNCLRVVEISRNGTEHTRYLIRDGNHRAAILSYLGIDNIRVCYEADYWVPSRIYRFFYEALYGEYDSGSDQRLRKITLSDVQNWPHVKSEMVTVNDAKAYYRAVFGILD